jgi:hypothetical protein
MRTSPVLLSLAGAVIAATMTVPTAAHASVTWYVGPHGTGDTGCTKPAPCDLINGTANAPAGTTVVVLPGTYGSASTPLGTQLHDLAKITLEGEPGAAVPTIYEAGTDGIAMDYGSRVTRLHEVYSGPGIGALAYLGSVDHVSVQAGSTSPYACQVLDASLTDSLCIDTAPNGVAVADRYYNFSTVEQVSGTVRGVTAVASGDNAIAFSAYAQGPTTMKLTVTNSVGVSSLGVEATALDPTTSVTIAMSHSDYANVLSPTEPGTQVVTENSTDIHTAAKLVGSGPTPYAEKSRSPTIDHAAADPGADTDLAGHPRTLATAPDMGAYEFTPTPTVGKVRVIRRTAHAVVLSLRVNSGGLAGRLLVHLSAPRSSHLVSLPCTSPGRPTTKSVRVTGLKRHTAYAVAATIRDLAGKATARATAKTRG